MAAVRSKAAILLLLTSSLFIVAAIVRGVSYFLDEVQRALSCLTIISIGKSGLLFLLYMYVYFHSFLFVSVIVMSVTPWVDL